MATLDRTIRQDGGGDYTTIAAWEAATPALGVDTWRGTITDGNGYDEAVIVNAGGAPTAASYVHLTVDSAVRHGGTWDATRMVYTTDLDPPG